MPVLFIYFLKLSISLAIVYLFYQMVLRKLTFYNSNRWYLVGYTLLSFLIPFINITPVLDKNQFAKSGLVQFIPVVEKYTASVKDSGHDASSFFLSGWDKWDWLSFILLAGAGFFLLRFAVRYISFFNMRRKADLIPGNGMKIYQVNKNIIPFSFGNSVFINSELHTEEELREIIHHEFVHVKQRHTIDILWSEWLCIINWYNPFAWFIKAAMRQNLEFIADNKVLQNGVDRKQYQYLLLKVIGNNHFRVAAKFNFSSLKKRITMMNKLQSANIHLVKFLFVLPLLAVLLLAFRSRWKEPLKNDNDERKINLAGLVVDAATKEPLTGVTIFSKEKNISVQTDEKGYYLLRIPYEDKPLQFSLLVFKKGYAPFRQQENWGNFYEKHILSLYGNTFEFFGLGSEGKNTGGFSALSGNNISVDNLNYEEALKHFETVLKRANDDQQVYTDTIPVPGVNEPNEKGFIINVKDRNGNCTIVIKDKNGKEIERMLLTKWNENQKYYETKYGIIPPPPPPIPPVPPLPAVPAVPGVPPIPPLPPVPTKISEFVKSMNTNNEKVEIWLKNGKRESYDLKIPAQKKAFEKKYGELPAPPVTPLPPPEPGEPVAAPEKEDAGNVTAISEEFEITDKKATVHLKNGKTESYDLTDKISRGKFENKFGKLIPRNHHRPGETNISSVSIIEQPSGTTVIAPMAPVKAFGQLEQTIGSEDDMMVGEEDVLVIITKKTTAEQLEAFKKQMKEKGIELKFDDIGYDNGKLVNISGSLKSKDGHSNFVATDFNKLVLAMIKSGNKTYFKVSVTDNKVVI